MSPIDNTNTKILPLAIYKPNPLPLPAWSSFTLNCTPGRNNRATWSADIPAPESATVNFSSPLRWNETFSVQWIKWNMEMWTQFTETQMIQLQIAWVKAHKESNPRNFALGLLDLMMWMQSDWQLPRHWCWDCEKCTCMHNDTQMCACQPVNPQAECPIIRHKRHVNSMHKKKEWNACGDITSGTIVAMWKEQWPK